MMALPTLTKTWQYEINYVASGASNEDKDRDAVLWMKNTLLGWALSPYTVAGSCDSVAFGMDGVDRWTSPSSLVWGTGARSWFVFNMPVGGGQLCFELYLYPRYGTLVFSPDGLFTGGSATARPTADDEVCTENYHWVDRAYTENRILLHMLQTTDGKECVFISIRNGAVKGGFIFGSVSHAEPDWDLPYFFWKQDAWGSDDRERFSYVELMDHANSVGGAKEASTGDAGNTFAVDFCVEGDGPTAMVPIGEAHPGRNLISGKYPLAALSLMSTDALAAGVKCLVPDLYVTAQPLKSGASFEDDPFTPEYKWIVFGNLVVPWNGTLPLVTP